MKQPFEILQAFSIAPTPVRVLVYNCLVKSTRPMSLSDIEMHLETVDKSTISRTLATFKEHKLIHSFNDGSGSNKYELCNHPHTEQLSDRHVHFRCEKCGITECLTDVSVPTVELPIGYLAMEADYVISGVCRKCSEKVVHS